MLLYSYEELIRTT